MFLVFFSIILSLMLIFPVVMAFAIQGLLSPIFLKESNLTKNDGFSFRRDADTDYFSSCFWGLISNTKMARHPRFLILFSKQWPPSSNPPSPKFLCLCQEKSPSLPRQLQCTSISLEEISWPNIFSFSSRTRLLSTLSIDQETTSSAPTFHSPRNIPAISLTCKISPTKDR